MIDPTGAERASLPGILDADRRHLTSWARDNRAEEIWTTIKENSPATEAQEFIRGVLQARFNAEGMVLRADILEFRCKHAAILFPKSAKEDAITRVLDIFASVLVFDDLEVSRKDQNGSRVRKIFVQFVSEFPHNISDQWRDWEVLALTEIAFPGRKLDENQIRNWSRRSTTKHGRAAKALR